MKLKPLVAAKNLKLLQTKEMRKSALQFPSFASLVEELTSRKYSFLTSDTRLMKPPFNALRHQ
jgi:hypothetical protein